MQEGVSLLREQLGSIEFLEERVHLFVLVGEVCLGYSRARYRRPGPGFDPAHPQFSIGIVWIGGTVESTTPSTAGDDNTSQQLSNPHSEPPSDPYSICTSSLAPESMSKIPVDYHEFQDVFSDAKANTLPPH